MLYNKVSKKLTVAYAFLSRARKTLLFKWPQWNMLRVISSWQNILDGKQENYNKMEMMIYTKSLEAEKKLNRTYLKFVDGKLKYIILPWAHKVFNLCSSFFMD